MQTLKLFSLFHLNLAFSSIPEELRGKVIARCYWPLLKICRELGIPIGIEASGFTLETIAQLDPAWIIELRALLDEGKLEFIGCGYAQLIGPLAPARVNAENLRIGNEVYRAILGTQPDIALINEQAYSAGMVDHYLKAGYKAIIMEWDNAARSHPDWDPTWRYYPQYALGAGGERIPVIWNKSIAFQKVQRYAHGEMSMDAYLNYLNSHAAGTDGAFPVYGNDAECFDFRPGRFMTEAPLQDEGEWLRIAKLFRELSEHHNYHFIKPSDVLELMGSPHAGHVLSLQSAAQPIPVKKQDKYNPLRWAITGRDDHSINTACWRLNERLSGSEQASDLDWKELCYLWSSDFRTHITEDRWQAYTERLAAFEKNWPAQPAFPVEPAPFDAPQPACTREGRMLRIAGQRLKIRLNCARGLAIESFVDTATSALALLGTLEHGYYDDIQWGADFYSGHLIFEAPGKAKLTDLSAVEPRIVWDGALLKVSASIASAMGPITKTLIIDDRNGRIGLSTSFELPAPGLGSLRMGHVTLNPKAFAADSLFFRTHNGGSKAETFDVSKAEVNHGRAVSFLVSANQAIGITEGYIELGDANRAVRVEFDKSESALVGMITCQTVRDSYFFRLALSAKELDDTSKPVEGRRIQSTVWISAASCPTK